MKTIIDVKTEFFPLAWFLHFVTPVVEIDGQKNPRKWGSHQFEVAPGKHTVKIYFPYLFMKEAGANSTELTLAEGETKKINYNMPPWMMAKGTITVS